MRVFVSGATGFIGGHLTASLAGEGHEIHTVARSASRAEGLRSLGARVTIGDLRDEGTVCRSMDGCEVVYHLATVRTGMSVDRLVNDPRIVAAHQGDVDATRTVVASAVETGVRHVVYASSAGVHGRLRRIPADETHPLAPDTPHRRAKLEGERIVAQAVEEHGISAVNGRLTSIYGPGDERAGRFFRWIADGRFRLVGSGDIPYHYTHVADIVQGLRLLGDRRGARGEAYLIGTDRVPTLREFLETIAEEAGVPLRRHPLPLPVFALAAGLSRRLLVPLGMRPAVIRNLEFFTLPRAFDVSRARRELGFEPSVELRDGIRDTLAWIRSTSAGAPAAEAGP
ncbi:MAG TPA: NAD-dependent epimerase/dehydratase family protein [Longimicrobiales bacterium]|nr:NAD-dependent epimerase/dehydratase family protein [Longimicrobiales bacterium]